MPPKPKTPPAPAEEPEGIPEPPSWPPEECKVKRMENAEVWLKGAVQAKLEAKSKAELQAVVDAERAAAVKSAAEFIEMTKQREEEAFTQRETTNREEANQIIEAKRKARVEQHGLACWPLRKKPVYISYAPTADWHERSFISRMWIDKNEGVMGSPYCLVDRADALAYCQSVVVILSDAYMRCKDSMTELKLIRSRVIGKFGAPLKVVLVMYKLDHFSDYPLAMVDHIQTIMFTKDKNVTKVPFVNCGEPVKDAEQVAPKVHALIRQTMIRRRESMRLDGRLESDVLNPSAEELQRKVETWLYAQKHGFKLKATVEWNEQEVAAWLAHQGRTFEKYTSNFIKKHVDGFRLVAIDDEALETEFGMEHKLVRKKFLELLEYQVAKDADRQLGPPINELSKTEMHDYILDLFISADEDGNGVLDRREFKNVLKSTYLNLSNKEIQKMMAEADEDDDGNISYKEFLPMMVNLTMLAKAKMAADAQLSTAQRRKSLMAEKKIKTILVKGMPKAEVEAMLQKIFLECDLDGNGVLDRMELKMCLNRKDLGLTRPEINGLLTNMEVDEDKCVHWETFVPDVFGVLLSRQEEDTASFALNKRKVYKTLLEKFIQVETDLRTDSDDTELTGQLPSNLLKKAMEEVSRESLGIAEMQTLMLLAESRPDKRGRCDYHKFVNYAAPIIQTMYEIDMHKSRDLAISQVAEMDGVKYLNNVRGLEASKVKEILGKAFVLADANGNGTLSSSELKALFKCMNNSALALTDFEANTIMAALETNEEGEVEYNMVLDYMFELLAHLDREQKVLEAQKRMSMHAITAKIDL